LSADIRTPLTSAYVVLFLRADLAIQLLDALWLQGALTDAGPRGADKGDAPRTAQCPGWRSSGRMRASGARIEALYRKRDGGPQ
jgi:hypothetical protein